MQRTALYRLYGADGRLLYLGIAADPRVRWAQHAEEKLWWRFVATREIEWFNSRDDAARAEVQAIRDESPIHNQQHNPAGRAAKRDQEAVAVHRALARRSGAWWALEIPELPGVFSQAPTLDKAVRAVTEATAVILDIEPEQVRVELDVELPEDQRRVLDEARTAELARQAADEELRVAMRQTAKILTARLSQRDAGYLMGISFQRVSQLVNEE